MPLAYKQYTRFLLASPPIYTHTYTHMYNTRAEVLERCYFVQNDARCHKNETPYRSCLIIRLSSFLSFTHMQLKFECLTCVTVLSSCRSPPEWELNSGSITSPHKWTVTPHSMCTNTHTHYPTRTLFSRGKTHKNSTFHPVQPMRNLISWEI